MRKAPELEKPRPGVVYEYKTANSSPAHGYLWPALKSVASAHNFSDKRAFDLGCGQGSTANMLGELGFTVTGIDPSETGIAIASEKVSRHAFFVASSDDDLAARFGTFPLVVSLEVVAFVYNPERFAQRIFDLLEPNGIAVVSSPYHGYAKNLAISLANGWDSHLDPFWPGTQVRFFSEATYTRLWRLAGFSDIAIQRVGRIQMFAKSMIAVLRKP